MSGANVLGPAQVRHAVLAIVRAGSRIRKRISIEHVSLRTAYVRAVSSGRGGGGTKWKKNSNLTIINYAPMGPGDGRTHKRGRYICFPDDRSSFFYRRYRANRHLNATCRPGEFKRCSVTIITVVVVVTIV